MEYSISYEIDRYEVHLYVNGTDLGGNNFFYCEEDAVTAALNYVKDHPNWTYRIFRREKAIIELRRNN